MVRFLIDGQAPGTKAESIESLIRQLEAACPGMKVKIEKRLFKVTFTARQRFSSDAEAKLYAEAVCTRWRIMEGYAVGVVQTDLLD